MTAPIYATAGDYSTWSGDATVPSAALLARASSVVDEVLIGAVYAVDSAEQPTDSAAIEALRDATCAQVQWFIDQGDTAGIGAGGELANVTSASILSASYTIDKGAAATAARTLSGVQIAPGVLSVLRAAALLPVSVYVSG